MRTEIGLSITIFLGLLIKYLHWPGGGVVIVFAFSLLAMLYFPGGFYFFSDKKIKNSNLALSIISGMFLSITLVGILFKIQYWPGANVNLKVGCITAPILLAVIIFMKSKAAENLNTYYKNMMTRTGVLSILGLLFFFTSTETLVHIQYGEDPEVARLKTLIYTTENREQYKQELDEYITIRDSLATQKWINENK
jgi:hypothetical protein